MRISAQSSQFIFNLPIDFIEPYLYDQFQKLMDKNFVPYDSVVEYLSSTIKEIVFPSSSYENREQVLKRGKVVAWKDSKSVFDTFTNEIDITFRSVDSYINYFMLLQILVEFYLNNKKEQIPMFNIQILDKDGSLIYTIIFDEVLLKSIGELRLGYQMYDIGEKTFTITFRYNFLDIRWEIDGDKSIFDIPIDFKPGPLDKI
ncbi:hypothetical protein M0Q97_05060 [Candidatus Dojkabacteria bacterium]|jgi:hypothetical protein|nr:hypothetical protein [Candidatus Dojkabacteria bacterium]